MTRIAVRVTPNARVSQLVGWSDDGTLRVKLAAPPVDGRANDELVRFLSALLHLPRSAITIRTGVGIRTKVVEIEGLGAEDVRERLTTALL